MTGGAKSGRKGSAVRRVEKPWGHELIWAESPKYVGKKLHIKAGSRLSLQYHRVKDETILVERGEMTLVLGELSPRRVWEQTLQPGETFHITPGTVHRMIAVTDCDVVEVSTPELDDVVRLEDDFGREGTSAP